jgi:hypothetical protein
MTGKRAEPTGGGGQPGDRRRRPSDGRNRSGDGPLEVEAAERRGEQRRVSKCWARGEDASTKPVPSSVQNRYIHRLTDEYTTTCIHQLTNEYIRPTIVGCLALCRFSY